MDRSTTEAPPRTVVSSSSKQVSHDRGPKGTHHGAIIANGNLMGLAPLMLHTTALLIARNQRILTAWNNRQEENARRAAKGLPPKTRHRRRKTLTDLAATASP